MKKNIIFCFSLLISLVSNAQNYDSNAPLPKDKSMVKGTLANGLTYYLHSTDVTKGVASYYMIQNVGSILEEDNQKGLAHFLEHMAFNGTESFKGKELLTTLQKKGLLFGRDINAYTSFNETVYNVNNLPTTPELINTGLTILHDWSNYLLLTDEEIDAERGVIKEEWRTRRSGQMRILEKTLKVSTNGSKYAERLPIGTMDIVENFEYKALRDFYHKWYRTDLQAIAIVGDFDIAEMEQKVKEKFASIPAITNPPERYEVSIPDNDNFLYIMATDKEVPNSKIVFNIRHKNNVPLKTVTNLKQTYINQIINSIFNIRFNELLQVKSTPFSRASAMLFKDGLDRGNTNFSVTLLPKPNKQYESFELAIKEINRAVKFGFTNSEINRAKESIINRLENNVYKLNERSHFNIVSVIKDNYLNGDVMIDKSKELALVKQLFNDISTSEITSELQKYYTKNNRTLIVTGVEGNKNLSKKDALTILSEMENSTSLQPYEEEVVNTDLLGGINLVPGTIVSKNTNNAIQATELVLSNGVKVYYKYANKNKNTLFVNGISDGGMSLIATEDLPSASVATQVVRQSGLGNFSQVELSKALSGKTVSASTRIGEIHEMVTGSSSKKDAETLFQLLYLNFKNPAFDKKAFDIVVERLQTSLLRKEKSLRSKISDSITVALYGKNNPKRRLLTQSYINDVSFDKVKSIYKSRFSNVADFTFFIVGDEKLSTLEPFIKKYIASIPSDNNFEKWKDNGVSWKNSPIAKDVYFEMENPKTTVQIGMKKPIENTLKNDYLVRALGDILKLRLTETLREQEGGTYGASVRSSLSKEPKQEAFVGVSFDCNPDLYKKLVSIVYDTLDELKEGNINTQDLNKTLTNFLKEREDSKSYNAFDYETLFTYYREGYNRTAKENFEDVINSITKQDIQQLMKNFLNNPKKYEIIIQPKK